MVRALVEGLFLVLNLSPSEISQKAPVAVELSHSGRSELSYYAGPTRSPGTDGKDRKSRHGGK